MVTEPRQLAGRLLALADKATLPEAARLSIRSLAAVWPQSGRSLAAVWLQSGRSLADQFRNTHTRIEEITAMVKAEALAFRVLAEWAIWMGWGTTPTTLTGVILGFSCPLGPLSLSQQKLSSLCPLGPTLRTNGHYAAASSSSIFRFPSPS